MTENDFKLFWPTFKAIILAEQTYAFDSQMGYEDGLQLWLNSPLKTYVFEEGGVILGSYYIRNLRISPPASACE